MIVYNACTYYVYTGSKNAIHRVHRVDGPGDQLQHDMQSSGTSKLNFPWTHFTTGEHETHRHLPK